MSIIVENQKRQPHVCSFLEKGEFGQSDAPLNVLIFSYHNAHSHILRKK